MCMPTTLVKPRSGKISVFWPTAQSELSLLLLPLVLVSLLYGSYVDVIELSF